jgi:hypothetical protein
MGYCTGTRYTAFGISVLDFNYYHISQRIRRTFFPQKCDLISTCVLCAEGNYFQIYKYPYICYKISLFWEGEICFQIMSSGITACERLTFLSGDLRYHIHCITCDSGYLQCFSSKVYSSIIQVHYTFLKIYLFCVYLRFIYFIYNIMVANFGMQQSCFLPINYWIQNTFIIFIF